jgi:Cu-Zn family superoxide dismutase
MKNLSISIIVIIAIAIGCKTKKSSTTDHPNEIKVDFIAKSNSNVSGNASFVEKDGKVTFTANLTGLQPGVHAIHLHEKSDCSAPDGSSAGGHWNPTYKNHGKWGVGEYHKGDIGNFTADANGKGTITMTTDEWCIGCGDANKDILGKGLIVHQDPDDFTTQPSGNAGARVACSAVVK